MGNDYKNELTLDEAAEDVYDAMKMAEEELEFDLDDGGVRKGRRKNWTHGLPRKEFAALAKVSRWREIATRKVFDFETAWRNYLKVGYNNTEFHEVFAMVWKK